MLRGHGRTLVALGALNNALPFWLLGFANTRIDSGLSAVIQAAAPVFTVVLASWIDRSQSVHGVRLVGVGVGFLGVVLLVGVQEGGELVGALAVIGTAACYAVSVLIAGRTVRTLPPAPGVDRAARRGGRHHRALRPRAAARRGADGRRDRRGRRARRPRVGGRLPPLLRAHRASAGASRAILVTYLVPAFALVYGAVFLDEKVTVSALVGLALILGGTALATGTARTPPVA